MLMERSHAGSFRLMFHVPVYYNSSTLMKRLLKDRTQRPKPNLAPD